MNKNNLRQNLSLDQFKDKFSASFIYAVLSSIAINFFYQPGHVFSSGLTGLAQIGSTLSQKLLGVYLPVSATLYILNIPLLSLPGLKLVKNLLSIQS